VKRIIGEQRSTIFGALVGLAGGKPTASANATVGKKASSVTEVADDEVCLLNLILDITEYFLLTQGR